MEYIASLWNKIFGKKNSRTPRAVTCTPRPPPIAGQSPSSRLIGESPMSVCQEKLSPVGALCPACSDLDTTSGRCPGVVCGAAGACHRRSSQ